MTGEALAGADAFADLYDRQSKAVLVFFARRIWDPEVAMDLTAETFARAFAGRGSFRGGSVEALRLRVVQELPYEVVAQRLAVSEQTARKRVSRGLQKLADGLDQFQVMSEDIG